jgi:hypothetical protein
MWVLRQGTASSYGRDWPGAGGSVFEPRDRHAIGATSREPAGGADEPSEPDLSGDHPCISSREVAGVGRRSY